MDIDLLRKEFDEINSHVQRREIDQALVKLRALIDSSPRNPYLIAILGGVLLSLGELEEAEQKLMMAAELYCREADLVSAEECWVLVLHGRGTETAAGWQLLGVDVEKAGRLDLAEKIYRTGWKRHKESLEIAKALENILLKQDMMDDVYDFYESFVLENPECIEIRYNLIAYYINNRLIQQAHYHLSRINMTQFSPDIEIQFLRLYLSCYINGGFGDRETVHRMIDRWVELGRARIGEIAPGPAYRPVFGRPLRIGWCSISFGVGLMQDRVVASLAEKLTERGHSCSIYAIENNSTIDLPFGWIDLSRMTPFEAAGRIRRDNLDCLISVDFTPTQNPDFFLYRPAPVILNMIHALSNNGGTVDGIITDRHFIHEDEKDQFNEHIHYLRRGAIIILSEGDTPKTTSPPCLKNGYITFGSFNRPMKLDHETIALWATALHAVPNSRIYLRFHKFVGIVRDSVIDMFLAQGIPESRITIEGSAPLQEFLNSYEKVDIALDPVLFNGGTTSSQALQHGVPVVTLPGKTLVSRIGASILYSAGLSQWCARDSADWLRIVTSLANNVDDLVFWRKELNKMVRNSSLYNADVMADDLDEVLRVALSAPTAQYKN